MKQFLKAILLTAATINVATIAASNKNNLNTNIQQQLNQQNEIPDPEGLNLLKSAGSDSSHENYIYANSKTLNEWSNYSQGFDQLKDKIQQDITSFATEGSAVFDYEPDAELLARNFSSLISTYGSNLYGIVGHTEWAVKDPIVSWTGVKGQFSPDSHNSSYTQENYVLFGHNKLNAFISRKQWANIYATKKDKSEIVKILSTFPQDPCWHKSEISQEYLGIIAQVIINHFDEINGHFKNSTDRGWVVEGNTIAACEGIYEE